MTISKKLLISFILILSLMGCLGLIMVWSTKKLELADQRISYSYSQLVNTTTLSNIFHRQMKEMGDFLMTSDEEELEELAHHRNQALRLLDEWERSIEMEAEFVEDDKSEEEKENENLDILRQYYSTINTNFERIIKLKEKGDTDEMIEEFEDILEAYFDEKIMVLLENVAADEQQEVDQAQYNMQKTQNTVELMIWLLLTSAGLLVVLLGIITNRIISVPIKKLTTTAKEIGNGKLESRVDIRNKDEIGELAQTLNTMAENLQKSTTSIDNLNKEIKQRKEAQKVLNETNDKLSEANQKLEEFVYVASHDLKEPIRKISAFGQVLQQSISDKLDDDQKEDLDLMIDGAKRMEKIITSLLAFSRIDTQGKDLQQVDLNQIIKKLLDFELSLRIEENNAKIKISGSLPQVYADPVQMHQLLQNLIGNGLKYHKPNVPSVVTIRSKIQDDGMARIEIQDNGIGIKKEHYEDTFKMFKRLNNKSQYEGSGIGLSICKKIVQCHNGNIGLESVFGQGTTFFFTIPTWQGPGYQQQNVVKTADVNT